MDSTPEKTSELERRISTRNSVRISVHDVDEDMDMMAMGVVADGFRPAQSNPDQETVPPPSTPSLASSSTTVFGDESPESRKGRPSSVLKTHRPQDSLTLRRDGGMEQIPEPVELSRQLSASTDSTAYLPSDSPYQGPSGPSHPYQMYPQNVRMARTMSTTTASTVPVSESSYTGPRGPSHPYGMYPQVDGTEAQTGQDPSIPLGFHGLPDQYQRRLGPDGEEAADLIGPHGHTEQLPPYTRYPDQSYVPKLGAVEGNPVLATQQVAVPASAPAPVSVPIPVTAAATQPTSATPAIPGAGGLGLATRNPEFDSTEDLGSPQSRHSSRSFTSDSTQSQSGFKSFADGMGEKEKPLKPWQLWMRRKVCGIVPYWAICSIVVVLLLMGIILGSVIGTFLNKQKKATDPSPQLSPVPTATFGAVPVPTPPDLQPLPTGAFSMGLGMPSREAKTCFQDTTLSQAWNCFFAMGIHLTVAQDNGGYTATLTTNDSLTLANNVYSYGEQPPRFEKPFALELVNDTFELTRGPAWYKLLQYDKTTIIPAGFLNSTATPSVSRKRIRNLGGISEFKRKGLLKRGDKPWVCTWPDVYLELFIYPQQNTSFSGFPPGGVGSGGPGGGGGNGMGGYKPPSGYGPSLTSSSTESSTKTEAANIPSPTDPPVTSSTSSAESSQTSRPPNFEQNSQQKPKPKPGQNRPEGSFGDRGELEDGPPKSKDHGHDPRSVNDDNNHEGTSTESPSPTGTPAFGPIDIGDNVPPPFYPRVIKLGERRVYIPGNRQPECRQVEIQGPALEAKPVVDPKTGSPVIIKIVENEPSPPPHGVGPGSSSDSSSPPPRRSARLGWEDESQLLARETFADMSPCGCMWWRI